MPAGRGQLCESPSVLSSNGDGARPETWKVVSPRGSRCAPEVPVRGDGRGAAVLGDRAGALAGLASQLGGSALFAALS